MCCVSGRRYHKYCDQLVEQLASHPNHSIYTTYAGTMQEVIRHVNEDRTLDLVYVPVELAWRYDPKQGDGLLDQLKRVAQALAEHPNKPRAVVCSKLRDLVPFFKFYGAPASSAELDLVVLSRWSGS